MTTPLIIYFLVVTILAVIATLAFLFELLEEPSWGNLFAVLATLAFIVMMISILLGIRIEVPKSWLLILVGVGITALVIYIWIHRDDPNVEINAPFGQVGLFIILDLVWSVAMIVLGILGLSDFRFVRYEMNYNLAAEQLKHVIQLLGAFALFIAFVFFAIEELTKPPDADTNVLLWVILTLIQGVAIVFAWRAYF